MATKKSAASQLQPTKSLNRFRSRVHELELYLDTVDAGVELLGRLMSSSGTQAASIREVLESVDRHYKALNVCYRAAQMGEIGPGIGPTG